MKLLLVPHVLVLYHPLLSVNSISADSVNLSWQGAPTQNSWLVYLVPDTSTLANTTPILVTNDTVNLAVNPNLNYNFYVNGICSAGDTSILAGPVTFSTPCVSFVSFPYNEDFSIWPPNCWDLSGGTQSCVHYNNSSAEASFWSWQAGNYAYMTSPVFDVSNMVSPELLFDWSHQYNSFLSKRRTRSFSFWEWWSFMDSNLVQNCNRFGVQRRRNYRFSRNIYFLGQIKLISIWNILAD